MKKHLVFYGVKTFPSRGGTDRVVENLIVQLKDEFEITLFCFKDPNAKRNIPGIQVIEFSPLIKGSFGVFLYFFITAVKLLFMSGVDLIHAHKTESAFFLPLLRIRHKVLATSHEAPYKRDKWNLLIRIYFRLVERFFIFFSNHATTVSKPLAEFYSKKYGRPVTFIPNGINPIDKSAYDYSKARTFLPEGARMDKDYILFSARRLMATKGCHTMLKALKLAGYNGQIFIAGELNNHSGYIQQLKKYSEGLNVFFLGFVHPLPALLALVEAAQFFIFPSETEGMSIMLLEVASAGKPIIASDIPENKQIFGSDDVIYFKDQDVNDLSARILYALANPEKLLSTGYKAQQTVYNNYTWKNIALKYLEIYNSIIESA